MPKKTTSKIKLELWDILLVILVLYSASLYLENAKLHDLWPDEGRDAFEAYTLMENNFNLFLMHTFHPPLTQLVMSVAFYIFGPTDTVARWVIPMFAILGLIFTYILGSMLYDKKVGLISSFLLSNSWVYMFYSARILTDISVTAVATLATFCFYYAINNRSTKAWVLFAITFLLAFLTKEQAWLIPVGIAIYVLLTVILLTLKRGKVGLTLLDEPELSWLKDKNFLVMVGLVLLVLIPWALLNFNIVDLAVKRLTTKIVSIEEQPDPLFYVFELPTYIFFNDPGIYLLLLIFLLAAFTLAIYVDPKKGIFLFSITAGYILVLSLWNLKGIGQSLYLKGEKFKIVGIATPSGQPFVDAGVFLPIEEAWVLAGVDEEYSLITAYVTDPSVAGRIKQRLKNYRGNEDFQVMTSEQLLEQAQTILSMVNGFLLAITSVSLIVGILGIANTMFVSITERVKQIGVMKTLGATNNRILSMILQESAVLGLFGGIAGCILGVILGNAVALVASFYDVTLYVLVPPWVFAVVIFSTVVLGTLSGFIPAYQASKLDPVEALKG